MTSDPAILDQLTRLVAALERLAPPAAQRPDFTSAEAFVWQAAPLLLTIRPFDQDAGVASW